MTKDSVDLHVPLPSNPSVPPKGDICFVNNLPPELLSRIFEIGSAECNTEDEDDVVADYWDNHLCQFGAETADERDTLEDDDVEDLEGEEGSDLKETVSNTTDFSYLPSTDFHVSWLPFPFVVSHVCRHWRNVSFSTPTLWTTIVFTPVASPPYELELILLEQSRTLPIDIYVDCQVHGYGYCIQGPSDNELRFLFSLLVPHIDRWRTMHVSVSDYQLMYEFLSAISDPSVSVASQLATLELYYNREPEESDSFGYPSLSKHLTLFRDLAPPLTRLVLWGAYVDWNQSWIASAPRLTDLELGLHLEELRPSWAQFSTILRGASALERLSLCQSGPSGDPHEWLDKRLPGSSTDPNAPIQLSRLACLVLASLSQTRVIGLLRKLHLPSLKSLDFNLDDVDYTDLVHELVGPATSPSPFQEQPRSLLSSLESLRIVELPCRIECIETLYGELQNLSLLDISSFLPSLFLDTLGKPCTSIRGSDIWLPRLMTLCVSGASGEALREVVRWRREARMPLSSLHVERSCMVDDEDVNWLRANVKTLTFFDGI